MSPEEDRTRDAVDSEPKHYQLSYSGPQLLFKSGYKLNVPLDTSVSVEIVVTRKSNTIRNFPCTVLQCPVVLTSLKASLISTAVSALKASASRACLFVGCLTSQQHASRISRTDLLMIFFTCCHTETEAADQTFHLNQSQYTDTGPTSPSADPITPGAWQGSQVGGASHKSQV